MDQKKFLAVSVACKVQDLKGELLSPVFLTDRTLISVRVLSSPLQLQFSLDHQCSMLTSELLPLSSYASEQWTTVTSIVRLPVSRDQ